jgi:chorismate mutase
MTNVLEEYRKSIDNIDGALVHLLAERFKVTEAIGRCKPDVGPPDSEAAQESDRTARLRHLAEKAELDPDFSERLLRFLTDEVIPVHHDERR